MLLQTDRARDDFWCYRGYIIYKYQNILFIAIMLAFAYFIFGLACVFSIAIEPSSLMASHGITILKTFDAFLHLIIV